MSSWSETLGATAQAELDALLESGVRLAKGHLAAASEFTPFAIVTDTEGRVLAVDLDFSALGKHPEVEQVVRASLARLRLLAPQIRCSAQVANTHLPKEHTDAVELRLEHADGVAIVVLLPYKRAKFGNVVDYGQLRAFPSTPEVWR